MDTSVTIMISIVAGVVLSAASNWLYDVLKVKGIFPQRPTIKRFIVVILGFMPFAFLVALPSLLSQSKEARVTLLDGRFSSYGVDDYTSMGGFAYARCSHIIRISNLDSIPASLTDAATVLHYEGTSSILPNGGESSTRFPFLSESELNPKLLGVIEGAAINIVIEGSNNEQPEVYSSSWPIRYLFPMRIEPYETYDFEIRFVMALSPGIEYSPLESDIALSPILIQYILYFASGHSVKTDMMRCVSVSKTDA